MSIANVRTTMLPEDRVVSTQSGSFSCYRMRGAIVPIIAISSIGIGALLIDRVFTPMIRNSSMSNKTDSFEINATITDPLSDAINTTIETVAKLIIK